MNAELIAVGSELLRFGRRDTNAEWLTEQLNRIGVEVIARSLIDDDAQRIASCCRLALQRADVVVLTGGLGPTVDDRTREALASALDLALEWDPEQLERLRGWYESRRLPLGPRRKRWPNDLAGPAVWRIRWAPHRAYASRTARVCSSHYREFPRR